MRNMKKYLSIMSVGLILTACTSFNDLSGAKEITPIMVNVELDFNIDNLAELKDMMQWAVMEHNGPVAVRYPRGGDRGYTDSAWENSLACFSVLKSSPGISLRIAEASLVQETIIRFLKWFISSSQILETSAEPS